MESAVSYIENWLKKSGDATVNTTELLNDFNLINSIYVLLGEKSRNQNIFSWLIKNFFEISRSKEDQIEFVHLFIPTLLYQYLFSLSISDKKDAKNIEICLLSLFNNEVLNDKGILKNLSFRLPSLARPSIYHEPDRISASFFTTETLHRFEAGDSHSVQWGPATPVSQIVATKRYHVLTGLLVIFNAKITKFPKIVLMHLCKAVSQIVTQGFHQGNKENHSIDSSFSSKSALICSRIPVTSDFLSECVHAVYFAIYNGYSNLAIQTINEIKKRAKYELFPQVLLMTSAITNSLKIKPVDTEKDELSVPVTTLTNLSLSKSCITNASFRTKKLPDDIPIQDESSPGLTSIVEEIETLSKVTQPLNKEKKLTSHALVNFVKKKDRERIKSGDKKEIDKKFEKEKKEIDKKELDKKFEKEKKEIDKKELDKKFEKEKKEMDKKELDKKFDKEKKEIEKKSDKERKEVEKKLKNEKEKSEFYVEKSNNINTVKPSDIDMIVSSNENTQPVSVIGGPGHHYQAFEMKQITHDQNNFKDHECL